MAQRSKYFVATLNNYTEEDVNALNQLLEEVKSGEHKSCTYAVVGNEISATGTPHLQGYFEFKARLRVLQVKQLLGSARWHLEMRRGTGQQASDYCKKDGQFVEVGTLSTSYSGKRTDLEAIRDEIKSGATDQQLAENHWNHWVLYRRAFSDYRTILENAVTRDWITKVIVFWGEPGTGKSRLARWIGRNMLNSVYTSIDPDLKWFDGYEGQPIALFDDFEALPSILPTWKRLTDRYDCRVQVKGSTVIWRPRLIIFTSNRDPQEWFGHLGPADRGAVNRRLHFVHNAYNNILFEEKEDGDCLDERFTSLFEELDALLQFKVSLPVVLAPETDSETFEVPGTPQENISETEEENGSDDIGDQSGEGADGLVEATGGDIAYEGEGGGGESSRVHPVPGAFTDNDSEGFLSDWPEEEKAYGDSESERPRSIRRISNNSEYE